MPGVSGHCFMFYMYAIRIRRQHEHVTTQQQAATSHASRGAARRSVQRHHRRGFGGDAQGWGCAGHRGHSWGCGVVPAEGSEQGCRPHVGCNQILKSCWHAGTTTC